MPSFANSALRLLSRVLGAPSRIEGPYAGEATALDGNTAVAVTETILGEAAGLGASFIRDLYTPQIWETQRKKIALQRGGDALQRIDHPWSPSVSSSHRPSARSSASRRFSIRRIMKIETS